MQISLAQQLLPRQRNGATTRVSNAHKASFYSNIFEVKLKKNTTSLYQYSIDVSPQIPAESDGLFEKIIKTIAYELKVNLGFICSRGQMIWGRKEMKTVLTSKAQFKRNQEMLSFQVLVKPTKRLSLEAFLSQNIENVPSILQVLNINVKKLLRDMKMVELSPGSYYQSDTISQNTVEEKLNVWRGYDITVTTYNKKLYLQVDPCSRVLRIESFLQTIDEERRKRLSLEEINMKYKGSPLLRRYGSPKIYKLQEIDNKKSPKSMFQFSKEGKQVSYLYYYKKQYGVSIKNENQPLIKAREQRSRKFKKEGFEEFIYLVPQLVCLTGLTEQQRSNFKLMKNLGYYTQLTPQARMKETRQIVNQLKRQEELIFQINENPQPLNGFIINEPAIQLGTNKTTFVKNGQIKLRQKIMEPFNFKDVTLCYSIENKDYDQEDADFAYDLLKQASQTFGIRLPREASAYVEVTGNRLEDWKAALLKEKQNMGQQKTDIIIIFFMKPFEMNFYSELKSLVTFEFNCPSQFIKRKNLSRQCKNSLSIASKIVLQMNAKTGYGLWSVPNQHEVLRRETLAVCGIASSKGKGGVSLALTGSTNIKLTNYFNDCKIIKKQEDICVALFKNFYVQWLQSWFKNNKKELPSVIIIYREGVNQVQAKIQCQFEVNGLLEAVQTVKLKAEKKNYNPTLVYLIVNKKPNSRIFENNSKDKNLQFVNPEPGSVIFQDLSNGYKEFHLASALVRNGSCTPVSFKVGYQNRPDFPFEAIAELTYYQTYSYFNWNGSVRVPAALQYANKLAKQYSEIGDQLKTAEKNSDIKNKLFYL